MPHNTTAIQRDILPVHGGGADSASEPLAPVGNCQSLASPLIEHPSPAKKGGRFHQLDALRGIAAVTVMNSHLMLVLPFVCNPSPPSLGDPWKTALLFSPLRIIFAGHEAVIFFFILSGFVLAQPFLQRAETPFTYGGYLVKRIIRIYPPYVVASLLALLTCCLLRGPVIENTSTWFRQSWSIPVTWSTVADHLLMVGSFRNCDYNPVIWSLVHEMRISIFFPAIMWLLLRHPKITLFLPVAFTIFDRLSMSLKFHGVINFDHDYISTLHYAGFFIVGAFLAKHRRSVAETIAILSSRVKGLILFCGILAYTNAFFLPHLSQFFPAVIRPITHKIWFSDWVTAVGVAILIILILSSAKASTLLRSKLLIFFGSISYSLYLFHALVLKSVITMFGNEFSTSILLPMCALLSVIAAWISWTWIEKPSIALARRLAQQIDNKLKASRSA